MGFKLRGAHLSNRVTDSFGVVEGSVARSGPLLSTGTDEQNGVHFYSTSRGAVPHTRESDGSFAKQGEFLLVGRRPGDSRLGYVMVA